MQANPDPNKEQMNVVFVGHVDHGKSTIIGRLLADTNSLPKGKLEQVQERCQKRGIPFEYAFLIDTLKDEQAQAITIDSARVFFQSTLRYYIIIDAPGHIEFIKNMVTGASHAEAAVLVIDAQEGVQENSRRHGYLLWMLGIKKIVVLINKMDLVDYKRELFDNITKEYSAFLSGIGLQPTAYLPVSGRTGDGVVKPSSRMGWFSGPTLLEALDSFTKEKPLSNQPLRLPVQDVYKFSDYGDSRRIIAGNISSGHLEVGDELVLHPSGKRTHVKSIESFNTKKLLRAENGQAIGFTMQEQIYVRRGQVFTRADDMPPTVSSRMRVSLFWLGKKTLQKDKTYLLKLGTAREQVQVEQIHRVIDASDYASKKRKNEIKQHDVAEVTLKMVHPLAYDTSDKFPETNRFVLVDDFEIRGGGIVLEALPDEVTQIREDVYRRNNKWIHGSITLEQREEKYHQQSLLLIITGPQGMGRKTLAIKLENLLFEDGKLVYYLGIGSFLYGVNADLKQHDAPGGWQEHVRRFGEVSHLFLDAGLILIMTAIELTQHDLDILKTVIDEDKIRVVWLGEKVTTDIEVDIRVDNGDKIDGELVRIKHWLQE